MKRVWLVGPTREHHRVVGRTWVARLDDVPGVVVRPLGAVVDLGISREILADDLAAAALQERLGVGFSVQALDLQEEMKW